MNDTSPRLCSSCGVSEYIAGGFCERCQVCGEPFAGAGVRDRVVTALARAAVMLDESNDLAGAMLEASLALVWMRKLPDGLKIRDELEGRIREEIARRKLAP